MGRRLPHGSARDGAVLTRTGGFTISNLRATVVAALAFAAAAAGRPPHAGATPGHLTGAFAIANGVPKAAGSLAVVRDGPLSARLDFSEAVDGETLRDYDVEMTQRLHLVVIGADFATFQHLHPAFDGRGHFTVDLHVRAPGTYDVYADSEPHGLGHQVFRFALPFGRERVARPRLVPTGPRVAAGPYDVSLDTLRLTAGKPTLVRVAIRRAGRPATDLRPYLGGAAHVVLVDGASLAYVHVHPMAPGATMAMTGMDDAMPPSPPAGGRVSPDLTFHVVAPERGAYKLWLQFRGRGGLYVAPFVLEAR